MLYYSYNTCYLMQLQITNLPKPNSLPYTWKRSDEDYSLVKQATDRSYKHTYGSIQSFYTQYIPI